MESISHDNEFFARITESLDVLLSSLPPAAQALWRWLRRRNGVGRPIEFWVNDFLSWADYSLKWFRHALNKLVEIGLVKIDLQSGRFFRVIVTENPGDFTPIFGNKTSQIGNKTSQKQPSNPRHSVPLSRDLKEQTKQPTHPPVSSEPNEQEVAVMDFGRVEQGNVASNPQEDGAGQSLSGEAECALDKAIGNDAEQKAGTNTGNEAQNDDTPSAAAATLLHEIEREIAPNRLHAGLRQMILSYALDQVQNALLALREAKQKDRVKNPIRFLVAAVRNAYAPNETPAVKMPSISEAEKAASEAQFLREQEAIRQALLGDAPPSSQSWRQRFSRMAGG